MLNQFYNSFDQLYLAQSSFFTF